MTARDIEFVVYGEPAPQGSKRGYSRRGSTRVVMVESSYKVAIWRQDVLAAALPLVQRWKSHTGEPTIFPAKVPVSVEITFTRRKPSSAPKTRRIWPTTHPDLDKMLRATLDALTIAGVFADDAQVIDSHESKCFPGEWPGSLDRPGARIKVTEIETMEAFA